MPRDKSEVECYSNNESAKHYMACWLVRDVVKVVAQEETHAASLPSDHTPKEEELIGIYHA